MKVSQNRFSRRRLLRMTLVGAGAALVASCGTAPTAQPTETGEAEGTPVAAATEVPTQPAPTEARTTGKLTLSLRGAASSLALDEQAIAKFKELNPGVEVETQTGSCGFDYASCKTLIAGGTMADAFMPGNWTIQEMIQDGVVTPLDPLIEAAGFSLDPYLPATVKALRGFTDGKLYALPLAYQCHAIYYNMDMFDKAGLPLPPANGDYTWHDLREWARLLTLDSNGNNADSPNFDPNSIKQWGFGNLTTASVAYTWEYVQLALGGGTLTYPDGAKCNLEHPDSIRALQFMQDMYYKDHSTITPPVEQENSFQFRFPGGELAMLDGGYWEVDVIKAQNPELRYDVAAMPREKAGNANNLYVEAWGIWTGAKNKELAWKWISYVTTEGYIVGMATAMPAQKEKVVSDEFLKQPGNPAHTKEAFVDSMSWPLMLTASTYGPKFWQLVGQDGFGGALEDILLNKKPAAEAVAGICAKVDALLAQ
jgi:multiple sugar transport system substrate-binding protein